MSRFNPPAKSGARRGEPPCAVRGPVPLERKLGSSEGVDGGKERAQDLAPGHKWHAMHAVEHRHPGNERNKAPVAFGHQLVIRGVRDPVAGRSNDHIRPSHVCCKLAVESSRRLLEEHLGCTRIRLPSHVQNRGGHFGHDDEAVEGNQCPRHLQSSTIIHQGLVPGATFESQTGPLGAKPWTGLDGPISCSRREEVRDRGPHALVVHC
mmetsp:Transcript_28988/g.58854  ORF Transcript_28988/g.58854 Transcript_28988/m.58854 type:complete len:208 (+) Transcript_28988:75-698(+)